MVFKRIKNNKDNFFATFQINGTISFSAKTVDRYNLADYKFAIIYYDKDTNSLAFKFHNDIDDSDFKLGHPDFSSSRIYIRTLLDRIEQTPQGRRKVYEQDGLLVVSVDAEQMRAE